MKNIAIICGGFSGEYSISIGSAKMVKKHLNQLSYNSYVIVIKEDGWYYEDETENKYFVDKN